MASKNKLNSRGRKSFQRSTHRVELKKGARPRLIVVSFKDLDRNQGQGFKEWEDEKLLALLNERLSQLGQKTVRQAISEHIIKQYSKEHFPPNSKFTPPKHVRQGVTWCSMHIKGKECVIGYFEDNIFHVVFLDKHHEFWPSDKKHT